MILIKNLIFSIYYLFIWILIWNWKSIPFFSLILIKKIDIFIVYLFKNDRYKDFIIYRYILYISRTINIQIVQCSDRDIYNKLSLDELFNFFHTKKKNRNQKIMWNNIIYLLYVITWNVIEGTLIPDIVQNLSFNWPFWEGSYSPFIP